MALVHSRRFLASFAVLLVAAFATACDDDPVGVDDDHDDHSEPAQVEISLGDVVLARAFIGTSTGFLGEQVNEESAHLDVTFLGDEGELIVPDDDEFLAVVIADGSIAEWEFDEPGEFGGHLKGLSVGETTATFQLMHGTPGDAHADFISHPVNIIIN